MKSITIHGIDPVLNHKIQQKSSEWGLSQNKTVLRILEDAVFVEAAQREASFRELFGAWSSEQAAEFDHVVAPLRQVDDADWHR